MIIGGKHHFNKCKNLIIENIISKVDAIAPINPEINSKIAVKKTNTGISHWSDIHHLINFFAIAKLLMV